MTFRSSFEHRDELLQAALDEFCTHGYDAASINRILAGSGVSKGQLYHHFAGKEGLYLALVEWMIDEKVTWLAAHDGPAPADEDFFGHLAAQIRAALAFTAAHPDADRMARAVLAERDRPIFEAITQRFGFSGDGPLRALVDQHHASGGFRPDLSIGFVQRAVELVVNRAPELLALESSEDLGARVDELISFLRHGLGHPPGRE